MKSYIVYDSKSNEIGIVKAGSHNAAEKKAAAKFPKAGKVFVVYTEL